MTQLQRIMKGLGCNEEEAKRILEDDKRIEKGEKLFELSAEQEKASKTARQVSRAPGVYQFQKRDRKADEIKLGLVELIAEVLKEQPMCNNLEIVNPEREFLFTWAEKKYKVTLSCPRS